jgi:hypothetical protein
MSNYETLGTLYDKAEKLIGVRYSVYDGGLTGQDSIDAVEMRFERTVATIYIEPEFDTLCVELTEMKVGSGCYIKVATSLNPWDWLVGRPLSWIWLLRNQQGYEDGFRFEFSVKETDKTPRIITLIGIASAIQIYISQKVNLNGLPNE